jgi:hypothetical protein
MWYSIASEQLSRAYKDAAKGLSMDELLQAEQMASDRLGKRKIAFADGRRNRELRLAAAGN